MLHINIYGASIHLHYFFVDLSKTLPSSFYLTQAAMAFKNDPSFTPHTAPAPAPTVGGTKNPKHSPYSDLSSTVSYPVPDNTPIEPTYAFKNSIYNVI